MEVDKTQTMHQVLLKHIRHAEGAGVTLNPAVLFPKSLKCALCEPGNRFIFIKGVNDYWPSLRAHQRDDFAISAHLHRCTVKLCRVWNYEAVPMTRCVLVKVVEIMNILKRGALTGFCRFECRYLWNWGPSNTTNA